MPLYITASSKGMPEKPRLEVHMRAWRASAPLRNYSRIFDNKADHHTR